PDPPHTARHTLSLHDALPIYLPGAAQRGVVRRPGEPLQVPRTAEPPGPGAGVGGGPAAAPGGAPADRPAGPPVEPRPEPGGAVRSEEHTSELQSRENLVCRLL